MRPVIKKILYKCFEKFFRTRFSCNTYSQFIYSQQIYISDTKTRPVFYNINYAPLKLKSRLTLPMGPIIRRGITCKKIPCYMRGSACRWLIVENPKIFPSYVKHF